MRADPFPQRRCFRTDCPVVTRDSTDCRETCFQGHATYVARCEVCAQARKEARADVIGGDDIPPDYIYVGETSRGLFVRHEKHVEKYGTVKSSGFMNKHAVERHGGDLNLRFSMERTATDRDPMRRVIRESIQIVRARGEREKQLMNSKDEYFGVRVVRPNFTQE